MIEPLSLVYNNLPFFPPPLLLLLLQWGEGSIVGRFIKNLGTFLFPTSFFFFLYLVLDILLFFCFVNVVLSGREIG